MIKPPNCAPCPLVNISRGFSQPEGTGQVRVGIIGEALGGKEAVDGLPFRPNAEAGSMLETAFRLAGFQREWFFLWNIVACQPPGNKLEGADYEKDAVGHCRGYFENVMRTYNPTILLACGNIPLKYLTKFSGVAKEKQSVTYLRGYPLEGGPYGMVLPTFHPSYVRRGFGQYLPLLVLDLKRAVALATGQYTTEHKIDYITHPNLDQVISYYHYLNSNRGIVLGADIETDKSRGYDEDDESDIIGEGPIQMAQFSIKPGEGIAVPYEDPFKEWILKILALDHTKVGHNWWKFDGPKLKSTGAVVNGTVHDTMWMFKSWQPTLLRNLQSVASFSGFPFPWKHLFEEELEFYGCADVDALQWIIRHLPGVMKSAGVWPIYERLMQLDVYFQGASSRGIPTSSEGLAELRVELVDERDKLDETIQENVPEEVRNIKPKRAHEFGKGKHGYGYKREPKEVKELRAEYQEMFYDRDNEDWPDGWNPDAIPFRRYVKERTSYTKQVKGKMVLVPPLVYRTFEEPDDGGSTVRVQRWCRIEEFKASKDQLVRYIKAKEKEEKIAYAKKVLSQA